MKYFNIPISLVISILLVLFSSIHFNAQVFIEQTGSSNPFNGIDVGRYSIPTFIDLDNDGDNDGFIGDESGVLLFFENIGDRSNPKFSAANSFDNPLDGIDIGDNAAPSFVDVDGDGDFDLFVGNFDGDYLYFENTGTRDAPEFTERKGILNPMDGFTTGRYSTPTFIDIDNDGDWDIVTGAQNGKFNTYENTGTSTTPIYEQITGPENPFFQVDLGAYSSSSFLDVDGDGDYDMFAGLQDGAFLYFENTGTLEAPNFVLKADVDNPMNGEDIGLNSVPIAVDLNFDSSADLIVGGKSGKLDYFTGNGGGSPLPIELLSFKAELINDLVSLEWATSAEINNDFFTIERSSDGVLFESISMVSGAGNSNEMLQYSDIDNAPLSGQSYYRLKQTDFNGDFEYFQVIGVNIQPDVSDNITIYPNPVIGEEINILLQDFIPQLEIQIRDLRGGLVYSQNFDVLTDYPILRIARSDQLSFGTYLMTLRTGIEYTHEIIFMK